MLSHVWAWLRRTLGGKEENATLPTFLIFSLFPLSGSFNQRVKTKTLVAHLREAVESLNAETINTLVSPSRRSLGSRGVILADLRQLRC